MLRVEEAAGADDDVHALPLESCADVGGLGRGERLDAGVHRVEVDAVVQRVAHGRPGPAGATVRVVLGPQPRGEPVEPDAELGRTVGDRHPLGRRDERLGRDDVGQDGRAAEAVALDDRDVRTEAPRDERGLVAAGTAADDHDATGGRCVVGAADRRGRDGRGDVGLGGGGRGGRLAAHGPILPDGTTRADQDRARTPRGHRRPAQHRRTPRLAWAP